MTFLHPRHLIFIPTITAPGSTMNSFFLHTGQNHQSSFGFSLSIYSSTDISTGSPRFIENGYLNLAGSASCFDHRTRSSAI